MKRLLTFLLIAVSLTASAVTLTWDFNDPAEEITAYCIYEIKGSNYVKVATVPGSTYAVVIPTQGGFHMFTCTASNAFGESPFSNTVEYRGASMVQSYKISK